MPIIKYNKLVRDRIPEIIEKSGKQVKIEKLENSAIEKYLDEKLGEEIQEYLESNNVEELADIMEVIFAIAEHKGLSIEQLDSIRLRKAQERGAFKEKLLLKEVID